MIQYGLTNMHRRKIRPKNLFYFLNAVVRNMKAIQKNFNAFRLVITGKLRGGTARTQTFSTGFGIMPQQTLDKNISYVYGDVRSKYGTFGVKLFT
jgi:ribosomal protein S3